MKNSKITLYLVRHAVTGSNEKQVNGNPYQDEITDLGKIQTNLLGMHLSTVKFDKAFSSDYTRAIQTARGILKQSKVSSNLDVVISKQLREINLGLFENRPYQEILDYCKNLKESVHDWKFPEGESFPEVGQRFLRFLEDLCNQHYNSEDKNSNATYLIVSHSTILTCLVTAILKDEHHVLLGIDPNNRRIMNNTCYMKVEVTLKDKSSGNNDFNSPYENVFQFNVVDPYYSEHLSCLKGSQSIKHGNNPILQFSKSSKDAQRFSGCVHQ